MYSLSMAHRSELDSHLHTLLEVGRFRDYGPNGLQVEGKPEVRKLVSGVTASLALIDAAIAAGADAVLVHHGLFWRGQDGRVVGWMKARLARLLAHDVNLFAYHLPLDAHPELGNNAQLGARFGWHADGRFGEQDLGFIGDAGATPDLETLRASLHGTLNRPPVVARGDGRPLRRIAWCTGGAQSYFEAAIAAGADAFVTGEISEPQAHLARETGVAFLACGHHATERYGAPAVAAAVAGHFGLDARVHRTPQPGMTALSAAPAGAPMPIAITMGDACGIGPEIIARLFGSGRAGAAFVVGDVAVLRRAVGWTGGMLPVVELESVAEVAALPPGCLPVLPCPGLPAGLAEVAPGRVDARAGAAAAACIEHAVRLVRAGQVAAIVTAPIHKEALARAGVPYPGHTEMLQQLAADGLGTAPPVRMMLANDELRCVLVTIHLSLRRAIDSLSTELILDTLRITQRSAAGWGIAAPRIAVAGLESARRRGRIVRRRGDPDHRPGDRCRARRGHRCQRAVCARYRLHARPQHA